MVVKKLNLHYIYAYKNNNVKTFIDGWSNLKIFEHDKIN